MQLPKSKSANMKLFDMFLSKANNKIRIYVYLNSLLYIYLNYYLCILI